MKKPQHGGRREGAGRKPIADEPSVMISARVTPAQRDKFQSLGGSAWLRERIQRAKGKP